MLIVKENPMDNKDEIIKQSDDVLATNTSETNLNNQPEKNQAKAPISLIAVALCALILILLTSTLLFKVSTVNNTTPNKQTQTPSSTPSDNRAPENQQGEDNQPKEVSNFEYFEMNEENVKMEFDGGKLVFEASGTPVSQSDDYSIYHYDTFSLIINEHKIEDVSFSKADENFTGAKIAKIGSYYLITLQDSSQCLREHFGTFSGDGTLIDSSISLYSRNNSIYVSVDIDPDDLTGYGVSAVNQCASATDDETVIEQYSMKIVDGKLIKK